jgi:hypothetical protein
VRRLLSLVPRVRTLQYVLVAVVASSLGGATVVQAVAPSGILGTVQLADRTDPTRLAAVDAAGNVHVKVNNPAATQTVSGTVSVDNFPATQNVNVTGGTVIATPSIATRQVFQQIRIDAGTTGFTSFTAINASFISISTGNGMSFLTFRGPLGQVMHVSAIEEHEEFFFTQRIPITSISSQCVHFVDPCDADVVIIGD